ncbi:hypothetical protein FFL01_23990 [Flavobacterium flevense]|uniref:Uncharacterized protein n=1 Tax=Flavobacterium flevense TaxID=983 RepID=A0A4Y4B0S8_9FLAO|nr:hypothetical protein [Flavobacterium flevense]GEC72860.1 hypothetical protein FFL01_23990 [Flavobacterium flevense]
MKTILKNKYIKRLASLNDQFCFFQFNRKELDKRLLEFGPNAGDLFTTDLFASNDMAPRIRVKISKLPSFQNLNQTFTFGAYFSTSYEVVSYYLIDSLELLKSINSSTFIATNDTQLEEKYNLTLESSSIPIIDISLINTLKYLRLRRNHFTHLYEEIGNPLKSLICDFGSDLNRYWEGSLSQLDFESYNVLKFDEQETIDMLKLLKIIIEKLDSNLAPHLNHEGIAEYLVKKEYSDSEQRKNLDLVNKRTQKIITLSSTHFSTPIDRTIIEQKVNEFGWK